jgi:molybdopterin-guanine dinucleotide biosynthesis protein B
VIPIISIIGRTNSGKTTLLERLIPELVRKGYRVGAVKHHFHGDFEIDREGKDSWRLTRAGADAVVLYSPVRLAVIRKLEKPVPEEEMVRLLGEVDIVLTEGFKQGPWPKIEVIRAVQGLEPLCRPEDNLIAVVSDGGQELGVPRFGLGEIQPLAAFIEREFLLPGRGATPLGHPASSRPPGG